MASVFTYLVFLAALSSVVGPFGVHSDASSRIVGGQPANVGEFPYLVSIQDISLGTDRHFCGGAIYSDSYILTAAHCLIDISPANIKVVAGEHDRGVSEGNEQITYVTEMISHPNFNVDTYLNDIALLKLTQKLRFNNYVKSILLPDETVTSPSCVMAGWGATIENGNPVDILQKVTLPLWDDVSCNDFLNEYCPSCIGLSICAGEHEGGKDACHADDGGPLVCTETEMIGLSSWGYGCARPNKPGVYVELMHYKAWVEAETKKRLGSGADS
ncbi:Transmembrane protease serine 6 [Halocaridina rubra]|uniref:Transmembrane protease serine 6 n=1 Tax=Halocaridina rubra TaxID=373956 RepID=A0AAN9ACB8_HALRR